MEARTSRIAATRGLAPYVALIRPHWLGATAVLTLGLCLAWAQGTLPHLTKEVIERIAELSPGATSAGIELVLLAVIVQILDRMQTVVARRTTQAMIAGTRKSLFERLIAWPLAEHDRRPGAAQFLIVTSAAKQDRVLDNVYALAATFKLVGALLGITFIDPLLGAGVTMFTLAALGVVSWTLHARAWLTVRSAGLEQAVAGMVGDAFGRALRFVKHNAIEKPLTDRCAGAVDELRQTTVRGREGLDLVVLPISALLASGGMALFLTAIGDPARIASVVALAALVPTVQVGIVIIALTGIDLLEAHPHVRSIREALDEPRAPSTIDESITETAGPVTFEHVRFAYPGGPVVLSDLELVVKPGEWVAWVGESGCGKSTAVELLLGGLTPAEGRVRIGRHDVQRIPARVRAATVRCVEQDASMLSGSVRDNLLAVSPEAGDAALREQLAVVQLDASDPQLSGLLDRPVHALSGGQRDRLAIARALLTKPHCLVLDEAFASLDPITATRLQRAIRATYRELGVIEIAHRLPPAHADRIMVFDRGKVVQEGTHADLIADPDGPYAALLEAAWG